MTATYPGPAHGRGPNLVSGCPRCGRPPDPEAAGLVGLTTYLHELTAAPASARAPPAAPIDAHHPLQPRAAAARARGPPCPPRRNPRPPGGRAGALPLGPAAPAPRAAPAPARVPASPPPGRGGDPAGRRGPSRGVHPY